MSKTVIFGENIPLSTCILPAVSGSRPRSRFWSHLPWLVLLLALPSISILAADFGLAPCLLKRGGAQTRCLLLIPLLSSCAHLRIQASFTAATLNTAVFSAGAFLVSPPKSLATIGATQTGDSTSLAGSQAGVTITYQITKLGKALKKVEVITKFSSQTVAAATDNRYISISVTFIEEDSTVTV